MCSMVPSTILTLGTEQHQQLAQELNSSHVCINQVAIIIIVRYIIINVLILIA